MNLLAIVQRLTQGRQEWLDRRSIGLLHALYCLQDKIDVTIQVPFSRRLRRPWKKKGDFARTPRAPAGGLRPPAPPAEELQIDNGMQTFYNTGRIILLFNGEQEAKDAHWCD